MKTSWGAPIITLAEFIEMRPKLGKLVVTSGGFDPIHPGHISLIVESKKHGDKLAVLVNDDYFLTTKKGRPFQNHETRCLIVSGIKNVDYVIPLADSVGISTEESLKYIKPDVFTKGGDRYDKTTIPEWDTCQKLGIKIVTGVGEDKEWSSSWFTDEWSRTFHKRAVNKTKHKIKTQLNKYTTPNKNT